MVSLDEAQYQTGRGPCMEVFERRDPLFVPEVAASADRWEHFARMAADLGVHSTLSVHLPVDSEGLAASLNLYSKRHLEQTAEQLRNATAFAEQLGAALLTVDAYRSTAKLA